MTAPARQYFDLFCDMSAPDERWYLYGPMGVNGEPLGDVLTSGKKYEGGTPVTCLVQTPGPPLELTMTEDLVPILNERVAEIFSAHVGQDAQLVQARATGSNEKLWAVNVLAVPDCVDEARCAEVEREPGGGYSKIEGLRIDPARAGGHAIFRPRGWDVAVIVAEPLAEALKRANVRCELKPVS